MKRIYLESTARGCQTNLLDNALFRRSFETLGFENVENPETADVIVVNTCGFDTPHETRSIAVIEKYRSRYPDKEVLGGGCLARINPEALQGATGGFTFGPGQVDELSRRLAPETTPTSVALEDTVHAMDPEDLRHTRAENRLLLAVAPSLLRSETLLEPRFRSLYNVLRSAAFHPGYFAIQVSSGCLGRCTYCSIKRAKGSLTSRDPQWILDRFRAGLDQGHQDFWLVGDDLGCWGQDLGLDAGWLLQQILDSDQEFRLVINYFEPHWFLELFDRMRQVLTDPRVININLPMQSGAEPVIQRMGRDYDPLHVTAKLGEIRRANRSIVLKTHLMAGFPGESRDDFEKTLALVNHFDLVVPFRYTPRPGTPAATMDGQVSDQEKTRRFGRLKRKILRRYLRIVANSIRQGGRP